MHVPFDQRPAAKPSSSRIEEWLRLAGIMGGMAALLLVDLTTPFGIAGWFFYIPLMWYASTFRLGTAWLVHLSTTATVLIAIGLFWSPPGNSAAPPAINRFIAIASLWAVTILLRQLGRKQAALAESQHALGRNRERMAITLQSIGQAVVTTDTTGRVTFLNGVAAELLGRPKEDLLGQRFDDVCPLIHETTRQSLDSPLARVLRGGIMVGPGNHALLVRPDGSEMPIEQSAAPIREENGTMHGVVLVTRSMTERRRAEWTQSMFSALVTSTDDAMISKDRSGLIISWNKGAERLFGYSARETVGRPVARFIHAGPEWSDLATLRRLRDRNEPGRYEIVRRRKDGTLFEIAMTVSPLLDEEGEVVGASMIGRDVTEHRRTERALSEHEDRLRAVLDHIRDAVVLTDHETRITLVNRVATNLLGADAGELLGCPIKDVVLLLHADTRRPFDQSAHDLRLTDAQPGAAEPRILLRHNGTEVLIEEMTVPLLNGEGRLLALIMVFHPEPRPRSPT